MSDNMKNTLQIYCQQNKLTLPKYTQNQTEDGKWVSTVTFNGTDIQGDSCDKKTHADISAAGKAVKMLNGSGSDLDLDLDLESDSEPKFHIVKQPRIRTIKDMIKSADLDKSCSIYVLVDYENINKLQDLNHIFRNSHNQVVKTYKFLSYSHHNAESNDCSHIVNCGGSDAVDHAITMFTGALLANWYSSSHRQPLVIMVLTRDHYAECLQNFTRSIDSPSVFHIPTEKKCISILNERGYARTDDIVKWY